MWPMFCLVAWNPSLLPLLVGQLEEKASICLGRVGAIQNEKLS